MLCKHSSQQLKYPDENPYTKDRVLRERTESKRVEFSYLRVYLRFRDSIGTESVGLHHDLNLGRILKSPLAPQLAKPLEREKRDCYPRRELYVGHYESTIQTANEMIYDIDNSGFHDPWRGESCFHYSLDGYFLQSNYIPLILTNNERCLIVIDRNVCLLSNFPLWLLHIKYCKLHACRILCFDTCIWDKIYVFYRE